jgi:hypothetical protein
MALAFMALFSGWVSAHPSSGIVVDPKGQVFFQDIVGGVIWRVDEHGKLTRYSNVKGGHWLALDTNGSFSQSRPNYYQRITPDGVKPALIHAEGGAPLVVLLPSVTLSCKMLLAWHVKLSGGQAIRISAALDKTRYEFASGRSKTPHRGI